MADCGRPVGRISLVSEINLPRMIPLRMIYNMSIVMHSLRRSRYTDRLTDGQTDIVNLLIYIGLGLRPSLLIDTWPAPVAKPNTNPSVFPSETHSGLRPSLSSLRSSLASPTSGIA